MHKMYHESFGRCFLILSFFAAFAFNNCRKAPDKLIRKSAGCYAKKQSSDSSYMTRTATVSGLERKYIVSPRAHNSDQNIPFRLIFIWHALGQTIDKIYPWPIESLVESNTVFVYAQGVDFLGSPGWYTDRGSIDFHFFDYLLDEITNEYCIDQNEVYSLGYSFGAIMTNNLACYRSEKFKAMGLLSGLNPVEMKQCGAPVNIFIAHGKQDDHPIVSFQKGEASKNLWLEHNQCKQSANFDGFCFRFEDCQRRLYWCPFDGTHRKWSEFDKNFLSFVNSLK